MSQGWKALARVASACAFGTAIAMGCGGHGYVLTQQPQIFVMVDSIAIVKGKCALFAPDQTNGQLTYRKHVVARNSGKGTLCLNKIKWESANTLLKMSYTTSKPTNAAACPNAVAALAEGQSIGIDIEYAPSADKVDNGQATLTFEHNDPKYKDPVAVCFGISSVGPQIAMDATEDTFINTSAANPATHCYKFSNTGTAPLCFDHAGLDPANAQYSVVEKPNQGECIPALGDAGNPVGTPKKLQVCVRYSPDSTEGNEDENVIIVTNDPTKPNSQVKITAKNQPDNKYTITCTSASGKIEYDFTGTKSGTAEAKCNIYNDGPASMAINSVGVQALDVNIDQSKVDGIYATCLQLPGATDCVATPRGLSKGSSIYVTVKYSYPAGSDPPNGNVLIGITQANVPGTITIPISAGSCDVPAPSFGPTPQLWLLAGVGQKAKGTFVVANQSCATLRLINACITSATVVGADPCSKPASLYHALTTPFISTDVAAWSLWPLEVEFHPADDKKLHVNDLLNVTYCSGSWNAGACSGPIVTQSLNLQGSIESEIAAPTLNLGSTADYASAKVGQPIKIKAAFTKGQYDDGKNYLWVIKSRPADSKLWLTPSAQATSVPELILVPDAAGEYTIAALAQAFNEAAPSEFDWSTQVEVKITVQPATP